MATSETIARYFLQLAAQTEEPTPVTHMQLQKLLYYAQGWCLATRERPLFAAQFEAWAHGPVETSTYPRFADYEGQPIPRHEAKADPSLTAEDRAICDSIWLSYGKYAAWQLREMTHNEAPWKDARATIPAGAASRARITDEALMQHFSALHAERCRKVGIDPQDLAQGFRDAREGRTVSWETVKDELRSGATGQARSDQATDGSDSRTSRRAG